jgi:hypothetical protein
MSSSREPPSSHDASDFQRTVHEEWSWQPRDQPEAMRCRPVFSAMIRPTLVEPVRLILRAAGWAISSSTSSAGVFWTVGDQIDHARRQAGVRQCVDDRPDRARAYLGSLQDDGVGVGQRGRDCPRAQDRRRVQGATPTTTPASTAARACSRPARAWARSRTEDRHRRLASVDQRAVTTDLVSR